MLKYAFSRILGVVPVMATVAVFVFLMLRLTPGDPAAILAGDAATPAQLERIREALGLNESIPVQFFTWCGQLLRGDLGTSIISNQPVSRLLGQRIWPTLQIGTLAMIIAVLIAVPLGVLAAWRQHSWIDYVVMAFSVLGFSVPVFVVGYLFIKVFAIELAWLPVQGYVSPSKDLQGFLSRAILPSLTLATAYLALIARMTRASVLEVLGEDYVRTARAKGSSEQIVLFRHALRNAAVPIVTVVGTGFAVLITGVVVTESVFNIPGIGRLTVDAIMSHDYPVIQAMIIVTSAIYVMINLAIDLSYTFLDPRIKY
jgi:peptide/nickel transport system permease protein